MSGPGEGAPSPTPDLPLSELHRRMLLEESAIEPEVSPRGDTSPPPTLPSSRSWVSPDIREGCPPSSSRSTGWTEGALPPSRPDDPREDAEKPGKFTKYEQPARTGVALDVPPQAHPALSDPSKRLWIVEGEKKADSLVSRGECAIDVLGVWSWKREACPCQTGTRSGSSGGRSS